MGQASEHNLQEKRGKLMLPLQHHKVSKEAEVAGFQKGEPVRTGMGKDVCQRNGRCLIGFKGDEQQKLTLLVNSTTLHNSSFRKVSSCYQRSTEMQER